MAEWPRGPRAAERQAGDGAHVVLELAGVGALDGPVAGVVHARRHLVGDELAALHEELDGEHADVVEVLEQLARRALRLARERGVAVGRAREAQDAVAMHVEVERIEGQLAIDAAHADDRHFGVERHEVFVEQRRLAERVPGAIDVRGLAQHELALAVVAQAARLEHAGQADALDRALERSARESTGA